MGVAPTAAMIASYPKFREAGTRQKARILSTVIILLARRLGRPELDRFVQAAAASGMMGPAEFDLVEASLVRLQQRFDERFGAEASGCDSAQELEAFAALMSEEL